jgi:hypothetical protein
MYMTELHQSKYLAELHQPKYLGELHHFCINMIVRIPGRTTCILTDEVLPGILTDEVLPGIFTIMFIQKW